MQVLFSPAFDVATAAIAAHQVPGDARPKRVKQSVDRTINVGLYTHTHALHLPTGAALCSQLCHLRYEPALLRHSSWYVWVWILLSTHQRYPRWCVGCCGTNRAFF